MDNQTKTKASIFVILSIIFATIGLVVLVFNMISYIQMISYYLTMGYTMGELLPSYLYAMVQPVEIFWGVSAILLALNAIIKRLDKLIKTDNVDADNQPLEENDISDVID